MEATRLSKAIITKTDLWVLVGLVCLVLLGVLMLLDGLEDGLCNEFSFDLYPRQVFLAKCFSRGTVPWRNPHLWADGLPVSSWLVRGFFYPINWIFFGASRLDLDGSYFWLVKAPIVLHYILATIFAFIFLRRCLHLGRLTAGALAMAYLLLPTFLFFSAFLQAVFVLTWLPFLCLCLSRFESSGRFGWLVIGTLAGSLMNLAGGSRYVILAVLLTLLFMGSRAVRGYIRGERGRVGRVVAGGFAILAIGYLLIGVYWTIGSEDRPTSLPDDGVVSDYRSVVAWAPDSPPERMLYRRAYFRSRYDNLALLNGSLSIFGLDLQLLPSDFRTAIAEITVGNFSELGPKEWSSRFWTNMSVRYVLTESPRDEEGMETLGEVGPFQASELPRAMPRFYFQDRWLPADREGELNALLNHDLMDIGYCADEVWSIRPHSEDIPRAEPMEEVGYLKHFRSLQEENRIIAADLSGPNRIALEVEVSRPCMLVITDVWHPDWRVVARGYPAVLHRVNCLQSGVWCRPGKYRIVMEFLPASLRKGLVMTWLGVCGLIMMGFVARRQRRRITTGGPSNRSTPNRWKEVYGGMILSRDEAEARARGDWERLGKMLPIAKDWVGMDFGCGHGNLLRKMAGGMSRVFGLDSSEELVASARQLTEGMENASVTRVEKPPPRFHEPRLDLITVNSVIQLMTDDELERWLKWWLGSLSSRGRLVITEILPKGTTRWNNFVETIRWCRKERCLAGCFHEYILMIFSGYFSQTLNARDPEELLLLTKKCGGGGRLIPADLNFLPIRYGVIIEPGKTGP